MPSDKLRRKMALASGLGIWAIGTILLVVHSDVPDLALALVSIGGLMTIWFKLGSLEATARSLEQRLTKIEHCVDTVERELHVKLGQVRKLEDAT